MSYLICDEIFEEHKTGGRHPESPDRISAIKRGYESMDNFSWDWIDPEREAVPEEIEYYHTPTYIDEVKNAAGKGRSLDADTPVSHRSYEIALLAAGSSLQLVELGLSENAGSFGAIRPPGHHAESNKGMGFCLFNNIVIAAEHVTRQGDTVAIVDIDVHHGNGTQDAFYDRSDVLYVSLHQSPLYPGTGLPDDKGIGEGEGYTLNVTLSGGAGWDDLEEDWNDKVLPELRSYGPDYLMVSAGFDAHRTDPIGGLNFEDQDYLRMASDLNELADEACDGRILGLLEGGYNLETLERLVPKFTANLID